MRQFRCPLTRTYDSACIIRFESQSSKYSNWQGVKPYNSQLIETYMDTLNPVTIVMWVKFLLSLNLLLQKCWCGFFLKRTGHSCSKALANILEKHVMVVTLYRNTDLQYLMMLPARENLASLIWLVNIAKEKINLWEIHSSAESTLGLSAVYFGREIFKYIK